VPAEPGDAPATVLDRQAGWPDYAPGIRRRVLWSKHGQASMLYYAQPGVNVPLHAHGHDEECLMVQGDLFLDDVLLRAGDYQLAPAGSHHRSTETDTGAVLYAHGDLDLQFVDEKG
jgi:anti-sigma factor ChrR (cupin superfamily)